MSKDDQLHYCYMLSDNIRKNFTYNGYTNNIKRRIRQHNGEICGGARYTSRSKWDYFIIVHSPEFTYKTALSFEWHLKYPTNKRPRPKAYAGVNGRLNGLGLVLKNEKFNHLSSIKLYIRDDLIDFVKSIIIDERVEFLPLCDVL
jgi:predicted GIY-YIG superfamily endonuclease